MDAAAWTYLRGLLGPAEWDSWKRDHPGEWLELMSRWVPAHHRVCLLSPQGKF